MSVLDKIASAVAPLASDEERLEAHQKARTLSQGSDWLGQVLDHHEQIDALFMRGKATTSVTEREALLTELGTLLTGHSIAEEAVLYPAMVKDHHEAKATMAYGQQAMAKTEVALLEDLDPTSEEWDEKFEHIVSAVRQHVYQEESSWFVDLAQSDEVTQSMLTQKYSEQFNRYMGGDKPAMFN